MNKALPAWALRAATPADHALAQEAQRQGTMRITWPEPKALRAWAKQQGWPTPWFHFEEAFLANMLATETHFALAIGSSGVAVQFPRQHFTIPEEELRKLDALYTDRSSSGHPTGWNTLVEELREIRRAVEAGVAVHVEAEPPLQNWQEFYRWAHGRYHMLEDGADKWIGDDT